MLRLEENITELGAGEFLFIGYGYDIEEIQNILLFLKIWRRSKYYKLYINIQSGKQESI